MKKAIIGKKIGMTQIFAEDGRVVPVTVIEAGPCVVVQKKTMDKDGYEAIQVGYGDIRKKLLNKPETGHFNKAGVALRRLLKEFRFDDCAPYEIGQELRADVFETGDIVDVMGVSKGKGFQGAIKRHNQSRGPMSHGSRYHRGPGSMGACSSPSRVFPGKGLPGHMGHEKVTIQNLEVVRVDNERNLMLVKGSLPGPKGSVIVVKDAVKAAAK